MTEGTERKINTRSIFSLISGDRPDRDVAVMSRMIKEKKQHEELIEKTNKMLTDSIIAIDERKEKIQIRLRNRLKHSKSRK